MYALFIAAPIQLLFRIERQDGTAEYSCRCPVFGREAFVTGRKALQPDVTAVDSSNVENSPHSLDRLDAS